MLALNNSDVVFELEGLNSTPALRHVFFSLALTSYLLTVAVNLMLVVTVCLHPALHQPIYIFVCNLCVNGICGASCFYPKMMHDLRTRVHAITYGGCLGQMFVIYTYVFCEFTSLTVMAYDRYVAICRPLRYRVLMTARRVATLLLLTWAFSMLEAAAGITLTAMLPVCGRRVRNMFCTNWEVVKLSCSDTTANNIYGLALTVSHVLQTALILVSYGHLVRAAVRSRADRRKFVQTCLPHLVTLLVFTGSLVFEVMYARYGGAGALQPLRNALAAEFLVVPPLVNPAIYGMNLQQIRIRILNRVTAAGTRASD
ncbi:olfactory receptor 2G6-like [Salarias fasciatus]|uniref:olfactory receptor 2G6-like n=1 Tax=Salarias fasciatus TaxID=181472 RepID=UPI001176677A|nr:olfactory receptor 2G6-like [Salarias fasciatus]